MGKTSFLILDFHVVYSIHSTFVLLVDSFVSLLMPNLHKFLSLIFDFQLIAVFVAASWTEGSMWGFLPGGNKGYTILSWIFSVFFFRENVLFHLCFLLFMEEFFIFLVSLLMTGLSFYICSIAVYQI